MSPARAAPRPRGRLAWLLALVLLAAGPASAAPRKRAVLLLAADLDASAVFRELEAPRYAALRASTGLGLMNAQSPSPVDELSSYATVGAGARVRFDPGGNTLARPDGRLRGGLWLALKAGGKRAVYAGPANKGPQPWTGRPGLLAALDWESPANPVAGCGAGALPVVLRELETADLLIYDRPGADCGSSLEFLDALRAHLDPRHDLVVVTDPAPGEAINGQWKSLAPLLVWGGGWAGRGATSSTTRTPALVANVDLAPTLLEHLGLPVPDTMSGHPIRPAAETTPARLASWARNRRAVRELMIPGLVAWGATAFAACAWALFALLRGHAGWSPGFGRRLLALPISLAAGMLLATRRQALDVEGLALDICVTGALVWAACAFFSTARLGKRPLAFPPLLCAFAILTALVLGDLFLRAGMLQQNLLSDFPNIGARFYGIGNEWEGLLLGTTLLLPFWIEELRGRPLPGSGVLLSPGGRVAAGLLWGATLAGVAAPALGADFGGAVTFTLAFGISAAVFAAPGADLKRRLRRLAGAAALAAAAAGVLILLDTLRPAGSRTHVGELAARAIRGEWWPVFDMVARKLALNVQTALSPYTLGGLAAAAPLLWLCYHRLGRGAMALLAARPRFRAGLLSVLAGGVAGLLLNDTGVVTWAMATGCALLAFLDALLTGRIVDPQREKVFGQ